jgi:parallel beta-helix repeat protein
VQGFNIYYARNIIFDGCIAHGQTSAFGCGFVVEYQCEDVTLTNCIAYDNTRSGFYFEGNIATGVRNITLNNCFGFSNGEAGITLDANYLDIAINGGAYHNNTGTFGAGTGFGISAAANLGVTICGATIIDNASHGIQWLANPYQAVISNCLIRENGGYGIYFTGTVGSVQISGNTFFNNASGAVSGWDESGGNYIDGPWVSWTPTWYKNDGVTTIAVSAQSAFYKRIGSTVFYNAKVTFSGTPDNSTSFTLPIEGAWSNGSTGDAAARPRGSASGAATTYSFINGLYYNSRLRISLTASGDTTLYVQGAYEIA